MEEGVAKLSLRAINVAVGARNSRIKLTTADPIGATAAPAHKPITIITTRTGLRTRVIGETKIRATVSVRVTCGADSRLASAIAASLTRWTGLRLADPPTAVAIPAHLACAVGHAYNARTVLAGFTRVAVGVVTTLGAGATAAVG